MLPKLARCCQILVTFESKRMNQNPFESLQSCPDPDSVAVSPKLKPNYFEGIHNAFRGLFAFFCLVAAPIFIMPSFFDMFEEFGIDLPGIVSLFCRYCSIATKFSVILLPLSLATLAAIEIGFFMAPASKWKTWLNIVYWLALILIIGCICFGLFNTFSSIVYGLTSD